MGAIALSVFEENTIDSWISYDYYLPYPLECNPWVLFFVTGFLVGFNSNNELWMTEYWVLGEHKHILNIDRFSTNMHNSNFKGFAWVTAQGTNLSFGWGSIQEWGSNNAKTVRYLQWTLSTILYNTEKLSIIRHVLTTSPCKISSNNFERSRCLKLGNNIFLDALILCKYVGWTLHNWS